MILGGAGLDVATVLTVRSCQRTAARLLAGQLVEGSIEAAGTEGLTGLDLLAALPPLGVGVGEDVEL